MLHGDTMALQVQGQVLAWVTIYVEFPYVFFPDREYS